MRTISQDGEDWYDVTDEKFRELLADESLNFWVQLSPSWFAAACVIRQMAYVPDAGRTANSSDTLFGIPVFYGPD